MRFAAFLLLAVALVAAETSYNYPSSQKRVPMPYSFKYVVNDHPSANDYGHEEKSDGEVVTGSYYVLLPDGRRQVVTYKAGEHGYTVDVKYEAARKAYHPDVEYPRPYYHSYPAVYPRPAYKAYPGAEVSDEAPAAIQDVSPTKPSFEVAQKVNQALEELSNKRVPTGQQIQVDDPSAEIPEEVNDEVSTEQVPADGPPSEITSQANEGPLSLDEPSTEQVPVPTSEMVEQVTEVQSLDESTEPVNVEVPTEAMSVESTTESTYQ